MPGSSRLGSTNHHRPIRLTGDPDHRMDEVRIGDLGDLFVLLRLDHMGIHAVKIRADGILRRRSYENDVVILHLPFASK